MSGPVEVDEMYLGEREKNKHANKKINTKKTAVVGIKNMDTGTIVAMPVLKTTASRLEHFIKSNTIKGAKVHTDENKVYNSNLDNHETIKHGDGEYVRGDVHINRIKSFWTLQGAGTTEHFIASTPNTCTATSTNFRDGSTWGC